jgi:hypothetical protein
MALPVPVVQHQRNFNRYDIAIYEGILAYRVGDYLSTERALSHGGVEVELPQCFVATKSGFLTYSLGMGALEIAGSIYMHRHGHRKLARIADTLSLAGGSATVINNLRVRETK